MGLNQKCFRNVWAQSLSLSWTKACPTPFCAAARNAEIHWCQVALYPGQLPGEWDTKSALMGFLPVPTLTQMPLHSNSRRHLLQLAIKLSRGTGCQTCAAGDYWLGASSPFGAAQGEPTHISAGALPSHRPQPKGLAHREGHCLQNTAEAQ